MELKNIHSVYFIGIGGIGMSALARFYLSKGVSVGGYDKVCTPLTESLIKEGAAISYSDELSEISTSFKNAKTTLVVYTPAIASSHKGYNYFKDNGFNLVKRSELLGLVTDVLFTIGVSGTHGKTTTSSIVTHVLNNSGFPVNAFLGGISSNLNSNFLLNEKAETVVVEADEYDRSFLTLSPNIAIVTSMDADHLDIYGEHSYLNESFEKFVAKLPSDGVLIKRKGLSVDHNNTLEYAVDQKADYYATNINIENGEYHFDIVTPEERVKDVVLGMPGLHNVENAVAAIAVGMELGISISFILAALKSFKGVKRRFEYHVKTDAVVYIDDYAHHPVELKACINSVKEMYPAKKITGVFQPHLYSRTRDFADDFAVSLDLLDEVLLLDIYPARELPIEGVSSSMLLNKISNECKELLSKEELVESIADRKLEVLLTLGAGDIDELIEPIKKKLMTKKSLIV